MRRSLGGGSGSMGGSSVQMLRSVQRAVRASAAGEPFSHSTTGSASKNPTSAGRKARQSKVNGGGRGSSLTISSSLTSGNIPISASSTTWPSSPTFSDDSFDWVCVDGLDEDGAQPVYDDYVFGSVPSVEEVNLAVLALKEVLDPGSPANMAKDKSVEGTDSMNSSSSSSTGAIQVASPFGAKIDWIEPSSQLWSSSLSQARGYDIASDAFYMLRNEPTIQDLKTLQKKLKELKSQLSYAIFSPPPNADRQLLVAEIEKRFLFVTKLLTAEFASSSSTNPSSHRHLRHIVKIIEDLELDFNEWKNHREITRAGDSPNSNCSCDDDSGSEDDASNVRSASVLGTGDQDILDFTEGLVDVDVKLEQEKAAEGGGATAAVCKEKGGGKIGSYFGGLMTGMVFGMILMGWAMGLDDIRLPLYPTEHRAYLFPT